MKENNNTLIFYAFIATLVLVFLGGEAHRIIYFPFDLVISKAFQSHSDKVLDLLFNSVSYLGFPSQVYFFSALIVALLGLKKMYLEMKLMAINILVSGAFSTLIKRLVNRPRVEEKLLNVFHKGLEGGKYSFPAGHVVSFVAIFGFLAIIFIKKGGRLGKLFTAICILLIILIGPSRIYLGEHWTSDVIGGYLVGSIVLALVSFVYFKYLSKNRSES